MHTPADADHKLEIRNDARKELGEKLNLKGILVGGRIPGYAAHAATLTSKQYIEKVRQKEIIDMAPVFRTSGWWVWAEPRDAQSAWSFSFNHGCVTRDARINSCYGRAFGVRRAPR
jgi:hypothetical protein